MLINKINSPYNTNINFKALKPPPPCNLQEFDAFDDSCRNFSKAQKNYYSHEIYYNSGKNNEHKGLPVIIPVNGDDLRFLRFFYVGLINKLKPNQKNLAMYNANYTINGCIHSDKGYTDGIYDCIVVLLYNDEDAYLYHLNSVDYSKPEYLQDMKEAFEDNILDLSKDGKTCKAFLYGGDGAASQKLYENICKVLDEHPIHKDEVVLSNSEAGNAIYYDVKKGIILSNDTYAYHSKQQLEENFGRVKLSNYYYSEI